MLHHEEGRFDAGAHGVLRLAWSERGLVRLHFDDGVSTPPEVTADVPAPIADVLRAYFAGEAVDPAVLPVDLTGTPFQVRVWNALRTIPRGSVRTYAGIAQAVGSPRGMRAVGLANGANPVAIVVPCHRVIELGMLLGGYSGGVHHKRALLELEGARVVGEKVMPGQLTLG